MTGILFSFDSKNFNELPSDQLLVMRVHSKSLSTSGSSETFVLIPWSLNNLKTIQLINNEKSKIEPTTRQNIFAILVIALYLYLIALLAYRLLKPSTFNSKPYA